MNSELAPLIISVSILAILVLYIGIAVKRTPLMFLIIPLVLACSVISFVTVDKLLGYPVVTSLNDKSLYLHHTISADAKSIYIWLIEPKAEKPRAVAIPNTDKSRKKVEDAAEQARNGIPQMLQVFGESTPVNGKQYASGDFIFYDFDTPAAGYKTR